MSVLSYHSNDVDVISLILDCVFGGFPYTILFGCQDLEQSNLWRGRT